MSISIEKKGTSNASCTYVCMKSNGQFDHVQGIHLLISVSAGIHACLPRTMMKNRCAAEGPPKFYQVGH